MISRTLAIAWGVRVKGASFRFLRGAAVLWPGFSRIVKYVLLQLTVLPASGDSRPARAAIYYATCRGKSIPLVSLPLHLRGGVDDFSGQSGFNFTARML